MTNYRMTLAFRGTRYHGFQVQENAPTVCRTFQDAVETAFGERYPVKGCSRTDAGVHANGFVLSMRCPLTLPGQVMARALNNRLPGDISVLDCAPAAEDFHPRYSCWGKRYRYQIWNNESKNPFLEDLALQIRYPLQEAVAAQAARAFVGKRDFSALCAAGGGVEDKVRTIYDCRVERDGDLVTLWVTGDGFLYNMVRILMGTVLEVCAGKIGADEIPGILDSRDRARAGATAPPWGLYLDRAFYSREELLAACPGLAGEEVKPRGENHRI